MKKILACMTLIIISCIAHNVHAQSAKDAIIALKALQAKTQSGIAYREYRNALGETKFPINLFFESRDATINLELVLLRHIILHCCEGCDMQPSWKKKPYFSG